MRAMRVGAVSVAAGLATCWAALAPAFAEPLITQSMDYYEVTGRTPQEVRTSLDRLSPTSTRDGEHRAAVTHGDIKWRFTYRGLPECSITGTTVTARIVVRFPRLQIDARTPAALRQAFARFTERLMVYQKGHVDKIIATARQVDIGISGLPPIQWCKELEKHANHLANNLLKDLSRWRQEYDDVTLHGRTLGAVFPAAEATAPSAKSASAGQKGVPGASKNAPASTASAPTSKPKAERSGGTGSGFFITHDGHVLTNAHVVEGCATVTVRTAQGSIAPASVLSRNANDDLALLKAEIKADRVAALRANPSPRAGESIVVYGFPLSGLLSSAGNATTGGISALAGLRNDSRHLQISAPVQPGNSGGPLVDMSGNVVGVVFSKLNALKVAKSTDDIPQNINFAIKASVAANFLDAGGFAYTSGQPGKDMAVPDVVERAKSFSVEVRCGK